MSLSIMLNVFVLLVLIQALTRGIAATDDTMSDSGFQNDESFRLLLSSYLVNITSNTVVNITNNTDLSSVVELTGLENVTIIGHLNPTINCNSISGVKFISSKNVTIEGINWEKCGSIHITTAGIEFYNSSDVVIRNCEFHYSNGRAVVLSKALGNVYIDKCKFTHSNRYISDGTALYYSSVIQNHRPIRLVIDNCNFTLNTAMQSVVYLNGTSRFNDLIFLRNTVFINNNANPIHALLNTLHIDGNVLFEQNSAYAAGGGILSMNSSIIFTNNSDVTFYRNSVFSSGGAIFLSSSNVIFETNTKVIFTSNVASGDGGGAMFFSSNSHFIFNEGSEIMFLNNSAGTFGGAMYCESNSLVSFGGSGSITFANNTAMSGGAVYSSDPVMFNGNLSVTFTNNTATRNNGGALDTFSVEFDGNSLVTFTNNRALSRGGAISSTFSNVTFIGRSSVMFDGNGANDGGAIYGESSVILINGNSRVTFTSNTGTEGGAIHFENDGSILVNGSPSVIFNANVAETGGAVYSRRQCSIAFGSNSNVMFSNNRAELNGGAIASFRNSTVSFSGNSQILFSNNTARQDGGAIYSITNCSIEFGANSQVTLESNVAMQHGGALYSFTESIISVKGNSHVKFNNNTSMERGGAVYLTSQSAINFKESCQVIFTNNRAIFNGGAIGSIYESIVSFEDNSNSTFYDNSCTFSGGAIGSLSVSTISFDANSTAKFDSNKCRFSGGAIYLIHNINATFSGSAQIAFYNNTSTNGGGMYSYNNCSLTIKQYSNITFIDNEAIHNGGAVYSDSNSDVTLKGNSIALFTNNSARNGGAVSIVQSSITFADNSSTHIISNKAISNGGAMHLNNNFTLSFGGNSSVIYSHNFANHFGGAIFGDLIQNIDGKIVVNTMHTNFNNNTASTGPDIYIDIPTSCSKKCFKNVIVGGSSDLLQHSRFTKHINTPPSKLVLNDSAVCIDQNCETYLVQHIMLGQEVVTGACVLNRFNRSTSTTQFVVRGEDRYHHINDGPKVVLISCDKFQDITIIGNEVYNLTNFSMAITSLDGSQSESTKVSIRLLVELAPCHPGFQYFNASQSCACYIETDIVLCSGDSTSTIKRGYWFGKVNEKSTISVCPNNYCNFTCCETANGYYQLSPQRQNQCNPHRSGTACGSCEEDYTLSFDSVKCVRVSKCTTGQTILVVSLTIIYWVVIVILVFITMYYHIGIGYLYAITYYYSMLDILLGQNLYLTQGVFTIVSIMSSIAKITPQFLGQLCLVKGISGIDQEFIHYVHPLAVTVIVSVICLSARMSYRFSAFVSRGIIHVICFLLLLSYTSVATTSLLLLRSLTFHNVDKVYTYLSPDIEYFHGRHIVYIIAAMLSTIMVVIGLPLFLLLEPFLNHFINFTKVKPLLDQFQGCYKDRYRWFAAYYMICRMVIIVIIVANPSNYITAQFILVAACIILALIQLILRPYQSNILNIFDGFVLQMMSLISLTPLIDSVDQDLLLSITFVLILLPLIGFAVMELFIHRSHIKEITLQMRHRRNTSTRYSVSNDYVRMSDHGTQRNVVTFDTSKDDIHYRESFMEVMDDIRD